MKKYTIKSTSDEGVYYLVNGWKKCKKFWLDEKTVMEDTKIPNKFFFYQPAHAKASLTKLLKIMPEYANDKFEVVEFEEDEVIEQYRKQHEEDVKEAKLNIKSCDNIIRAHAKSKLYGFHDPLLYAMRDNCFFGKQYRGMEYVRDVFKKYNYQIIEKEENGGIWIDVVKGNDVYATLYYHNDSQRIMTFIIK